MNPLFSQASGWVTQRRSLLRATAAWLAVGGSALLKPLAAFAADWNKAAFDARNWEGALKGMNVASPTLSKDILLKAPDVAEDGNNVPITVGSRIPNTQMIAVLVDKNTQPLVASFTFATGVETEFTVGVKVSRTSRVRVVVQADGKFFFTSREVRVTSGDCGS